MFCIHTRRAAIHNAALVFTIGLCAARATSAHAQQPNAANPAVAHADSAFQAKAWKTAADAYHTIALSDEKNGMMWLKYGVSAERSGNPQAATDGYQHSLTLAFQPVVAELGLARVAMRAGDQTTALMHLRNAATAGAPSSMITGDTTFTALKTAPEFNDVLTLADSLRYPCRAQHDFDFWVGNFDAKPWTQPDAPSGGSLHNTREYEGCVIVEQWSGAQSGGMSMAFYDANRKQWRMIWNDDNNSSNDFDIGEYRDGAMRFEGWVLGPDGNKILARNVLQNVNPDLIRHIYSTSSDGGKTWVVLSDGRFVRRKQ